MYVYMCVYVSVDIYIFLIFCTSVTFWYYTNVALLLIQPVGCHMLIKNIIIIIIIIFCSTCDRLQDNHLLIMFNLSKLSAFESMTFKK